MFTARYALNPYITQIRFVFKGLITSLRRLLKYYLSGERWFGFIGKCPRFGATWWLPVRSGRVETYHHAWGHIQKDSNFTGTGRCDISENFSESCKHCIKVWEKDLGEKRAPFVLGCWQFLRRSKQSAFCVSEGFSPIHKDQPLDYFHTFLFKISVPTFLMQVLLLL